MLVPARTTRNLVWHLVTTVFSVFWDSSGLATEIRAMLRPGKGLPREKIRHLIMGNFLGQLVGKMVNPLKALKILATGAISQDRARGLVVVVAITPACSILAIRVFSGFSMSPWVDKSCGFSLWHFLAFSRWPGKVVHASVRIGSSNH